MSTEFLTPPQPPPIAAERIARRRSQLVSEFHRTADAPRFVDGHARRRAAFAVAIVLLLGGVGSALGVGVDLIAQQNRADKLNRDPNYPQRNSDRVAVATTGGWTLLAWVSDQGLCLDLAVPGNAASGCGFPVRGAPVATSPRIVPAPMHLISGLLASGYASDGSVAVGGPIAAAVSRVEIEFSDERVVTPTIYEAPDSLHTRIRFFLASVTPSGSSLKSVRVYRAYDSDGRLLEAYEPGAVSSP